MAGSVIESLGSEMLSIVTPVSICMFLVVLLVQGLTPRGPTTGYQSVTVLVYDEKSSDSTSEKVGGALLNALVFVGIITIVTFGLVLLYYFRCIKFLRGYMAFSAFSVLSYMAGNIFVLLISKFSVPIDAITFCILLFNFAVVGVFAVHSSKMPIVFTQGYLVIIGVVMAFWFTTLPEWTTWVLLVALALYDMAAVLTPMGPLHILVKLAATREEELPAFVYEARPTTQIGTAGPAISNSASDSSQIPRRMVASRWRQRSTMAQNSEEEISHHAIELQPTRHVISMNTPSVEEIQPERINEGPYHTWHQTSLAEDNSAIEDEFVPLVHTSGSGTTSAEVTALSGNEQIGPASFGGIKLGLGDFVFYSVLVGRAAMFDLMTVYACYLAIIAGLGLTLILLCFWQRALPALPFSILLGVAFYFLARLLMEPFVVGLSSNLMFF